jgi:uncharacterized protein YukE
MNSNRFLSLSKLLAKTSSTIDTVLEKLEESRESVQAKIDDLERMSDPVPEDLLRQYKQIPEILRLIYDISQSNTTVQNSTLATLQDVQRRLIGKQALSEIHCD